MNFYKNQEIQVTAKFVGVADDGKIQVKIKGIDSVIFNVDEKYINAGGGSTGLSITSHSTKRSSTKSGKKEKKKRKSEFEKAAEAAWGESDEDVADDAKQPTINEEPVEYNGEEEEEEEEDGGVVGSGGSGAGIKELDVSEISIGDEKFHPKHKFKTIEISKGGSLIRTTESKSVMCAFGSIECSEEGRIYQWKIQILEGNDVNLGVIFSDTCKKNKKQMWWLADEGYSYWGDDGQIYHSDKYKKYGEKYGAGDIIDVILNLKKYNVSFAKNGDKYGKAFKVNKEKGYRLGVGISGGGHVLQLIKFTIS